MMCQSLWQTPAAFTLTRTSPAFGRIELAVDDLQGLVGLEQNGGFHRLSSRVAEPL